MISDGITHGSRVDHVRIPGPGAPRAIHTVAGRPPTAPDDRTHACMHVVAVRWRCCHRSHAFTCVQSEVVLDARSCRARAAKMSARFPSHFLFPTCLFRCSCRMHVLRLHNRHAHARVHAGVTAHGPPHVHAWWREWLPRVRRCLCARRCLRAHGGTCRQARDMTAEGQRFLDGRRACIRRITSQSDQTGK